MCTTPHMRKHSKDGENILFSPVPCGKCNLCKKRKINDWLFRIEQELKISTNPLFITLTYATQNLTFGNRDTGTLVKKDVVNFIKRLRHKSKNKLVYYAVGEYGKGRTKRPHYHIILFNFDTDKYSSIIHDIWGLGRTDVSQIKTTASVAYTLKYISKPKQNIDGDQPEFSLMSKGIGKNYLSPKIVKYHLRDPSLCYVRREDGRKQSIPKYYKEKIYDEEFREKVTKYNSNRAKLQLEKDISNYLRIYPQLSRNEAIEAIRKNIVNYSPKSLNEVL